MFDKLYQPMVPKVVEIVRALASRNIEKSVASSALHFYSSSCKTEKDVMYKGGAQLGLFLTKDVEECAILCSGSPACKFWVFDASDGQSQNSKFGNCELTSTEPLEKLSKPKAHSGSRLCGRFESFTHSQGKFKDNLSITSL